MSNEISANSFNPAAWLPDVQGDSTAGEANDAVCQAAPMSPLDLLMKGVEKLEEVGRAIEQQTPAKSDPNAVDAMRQVQAEMKQMQDMTTLLSQTLQGMGDAALRSARQ